jgi:hypothetical protein
MGAAAAKVIFSLSSVRLIKLYCSSLHTSYLSTRRYSSNGSGSGGVASLAPPALRSQRGLLTVDVVLETDDTFFLVSPHLQHNVKVWMQEIRPCVLAHVWEGGEECAHVVVVMVVISVGC